MSRIGSHSSRWKRANILLSGNGASGLAAFSAFAAPNLVDLSISTTGWISDSASFFERVRMPNVSSFTIKSANLSNSRLHFHRLTVMRVYGGIVGPGFFKGFSTSQTLVHLELHFFFPSLYSVFGVDVVTHINSVQSLPTLRSFRILARGFAPQIDLQHWVDEHTQATEDDESPSAQSLIVTFELYEISPQSYVDDIPFEAALSHLTHLSLHQVTTDGLLRRLVAPFGGPPPCPLLRSLLISCDSHGNHTLLREVITWRKAAGCPIVQLRLDKHFSNDHQFLNWVEENVELVIDTGECSKHKRRFG
ncbi:hypothetical protein DXG01_013954 [Tephrocybe rancida]|nr:hypothetical protein DXG01_013954 [Tephrocybe rancida]